MRRALIIFPAILFIAAMLRSADTGAYTETIPGTDVRFDMAPIPGGKFMMGDAANGPVHEVTLKPFWMSTTEVTWDAYDPFAFTQNIPKKKPADITPADRAADAITRPTPPYADEAFGFPKGSHPVISVTHHAAMEFCVWLSAKTGKTYRLPTEAEWEYAARAGSKTAYSFGDGAGSLGDYAWFGGNTPAGNSNKRPHPVGKKKSNPWGLYDMHGNVAEWCLDRFSPTFYKNSPAMQPVLLPGEEEYPHVVRGGSWDDAPQKLRSAARAASSKEWNRRDPQDPQSIWWLTDATHVGFRVVRVEEEQENLRGFRSATKPSAGTKKD